MSKTFFKTVLGLLAVAATTWSVSAAPAGMKTLFGHVPAVVTRLVSQGDLSGDTNLQLAIGLPLRNQAALTNLLKEIYDPSSTNYQHYLTPAEFTEQFGPTPADYQAVIDFAGANGFNVVKTHGNRMLVDVVAKVSDVQRAFHVTLRKYHHPTEARDFYAPDTEPYVDTNLPVLAVQGLNNYVKPRSMLVKSLVPGATPGAGSGPGGGYIGKDFRNAYVPGTTLNGSGQMVGLLQFDGYAPSDIAAYDSTAGLNGVPLLNVLLDGFNGAPGMNNIEVCLDIDMAMSMAPGLSQIVVFEGGPFGNANDILNSMASSNQVKQLSSSWGYGTDGTSEQIYKEFALQGQTYLNCSGDGDAWLGPIPFGSVESANVTVVGGTTLTMNGSGTSYASERAWNEGDVGDFGWNVDGFAGTSGGTSTDVLIPPWQLGINMATNQGSPVFRNVPDVALTADNIFLIFDQGSEGLVGGTSAATPLWAGYVALMNQQAAANHKTSVGFLAPALYPILKSANYTNCFHDTVTGNNTWDQSLNNFFAVPGYDLCTGLGTPNGTNLINQLVGITSTNVFVPILSAPAPPWGSTLSALNGSDPNGPWFLFVQDDTALNAGIISNGWFVTLTTGNPIGNAADNEIYAAPTNMPAFLAVNSYWNLSLSVTNYGPSFSTNVSVSDTLPFAPGGIMLASNSVTLGSVTVFGSAVTWNVGSLPVNAGGTMNLTFFVSADGVYTNTATVDASTGDPNPDDNTIASVVSVAPSVPPSLTGILPAGSSGHFTFAVGGTPGTTTVIQASTNMLNWVPIYTNVTPFEFTDLNTTNLPARFYRAVAEP